jgi:hypothetical protein
MTPKREIVASFYDPATNSIIAKPGYIFNAQKCEFEKVRV